MLGWSQTPALLKSWTTQQLPALAATQTDNQSAASRECCHGTVLRHDTTLITNFRS